MQAWGKVGRTGETRVRARQNLAVQHLWTPSSVRSLRGWACALVDQLLIGLGWLTTALPITALPKLPQFCASCSSLCPHPLTFMAGLALEHLLMAWCLSGNHCLKCRRKNLGEINNIMGDGGLATLDSAQPC